MSAPRPPLFDPGVLSATPGALAAIRAAGQTVHEFLGRHLGGDWGEIDAGDRRLNDEALVHGSRLLSAYRLRTGETVWLITEGTDDAGRRSATTVLLPSEY